MSVRLHLVRRSAVYYWRRRVPIRLIPGFGRSHLCLSLRTTVPELARLVGRRLTVRFDAFAYRFAMSTMRLPTPQETRELLAELAALIVQNCEDARLRYDPVPDDFEPNPDDLSEEEHAELSAAFAEEDRQILADTEHELDRFLAPDELRRDWEERLQQNDFRPITSLLLPLAADRGIAIDTDAIEFKRLSKLAIRVGIEALDIGGERNFGIYDNDPRDAVRAVLPADPGFPVTATTTDAPAPGVADAAAASPGQVGQVRGLPEPQSPTGAAPGLGPKVSEAVEALMANRRAGARKAKQDRDIRLAARLFIDVFGDVPVGRISVLDARRFKETLALVPKHQGKAPFQKLGVTAAIARADEIEQGLQAGSEETRQFMDRKWVDEGERVQRLTLGTIKKHLSSMQTLVGDALKWAEINRPNPFAGTQPSRKEVKQHRRNHRRHWPDADLPRLFSSPVWTGCASRDRRAQSGSEIIRDAKFWVPLLGALNGLRLEEACQLHAKDVLVDEGGVICLRIEPGGGKIVKTESSIRTIPVHPLLIRLGFPDYAEAAREAGHVQLFPELKRGGPYRLFGYRFSKWWTEYRRQIGLYEPGLDFHSFRHSFSRKLHKAQVNDSMISALMGHATSSIIRSIYFAEGYAPADLVEPLSRLDYGLKLDHLCKAEA